MNRYTLTAEAQDDLRQIRDYVLDEGGFRVARHAWFRLRPRFVR
jgi:plasmid stabilization system protein ParE